MRQSVENFDFSCFTDERNPKAHIDRVKQLSDALGSTNKLMTLQEKSCYPFECKGNLKMTERECANVAQSELINVANQGQKTDPKAEYEKLREYEKLIIKQDTDVSLLDQTKDQVNSFWNLVTLVYTYDATKDLNSFQRRKEALA